MGFKAIKQHYDIGYIVAIYNEGKIRRGLYLYRFRVCSRAYSHKYRNR